MAHRPRIPAPAHVAPVAVTRRRYPPEAMVRVQLVEHGPPAREALREAVGAVKGMDPLAPVTVAVPSTYAGLEHRRTLRTPDDPATMLYHAHARLPTTTITLDA